MGRRADAHEKAAVGGAPREAEGGRQGAELQRCRAWQERRPEGAGVLRPAVTAAGAAARRPARPAIPAPAAARPRLGRSGRAAKAEICHARRPGVMFHHLAAEWPFSAGLREWRGDGGAGAGHLHMPAMPPGAAPPSPRRSQYRAAGLVPPGAALGPRAASSPLVGDYQEAYRSLVAGLAGGGRSLIPPGHPLYSRIDSAAALRAENEALRKEIADLRARSGAGAGEAGDGRRPERGAPGAQPL